LITADTTPTAEEVGSRQSVFWLDLNGQVSRWSPSATTLFAYEAEEVRGRPFADLFTAEEREALKPELALQQAREFGCWSETGWRRARDGEPLWVASTVTFVRTPNGLEIGYHVATRELTPTDGSAPTEGQSAEEVLRLLALGRLAGDVAHELNNLLSALRGFGHVIGRHLPGAGVAHEAWRQTLKACDRGTDLTRQLLGLGRPGDDALQSIDVAEAVREIEPLLRQTLPERILLVTSLPSGLPRVLARSRDIDLALLNLVVNARDAIAAHGTIAIQARLEGKDSGAPPRVALSVRDSGSGMSPEVQARAFDRFFTTKSSELGTGLGLSLVRDAVRGWGGSVELASGAGSGTCVTLLLMLAEATDVQEELFSASAGASLAPPQGRVMVCAPSPTRDLVADLLTRKGYTVSSVEDEDDARRLLASETSGPDVVVVGGPAAAGDCAGLVAALKGMLGRLPAVVVLATESGSSTSPWHGYPWLRLLWGPIVPGLLVEEIERSLGSSHEPSALTGVH